MTNHGFYDAHHPIGDSKENKKSGIEEVEMQSLLPSPIIFGTNCFSS